MSKEDLSLEEFAMILNPGEEAGTGGPGGAGQEGGSGEDEDDNNG